jgi:predicted lysophospholipase L1 biosynthesis ABC-type transport system permease subunit
LVATRWAFGFLGVLGVVAAVGALVALAMFLAARRRTNALAAVMTRAMGLSARRAALVTALEITTITALAMVAGFGAAVLSVDRLVPRFDPAPDLPPPVPVTVSWPLLVGAGVLGLVALGLVVWAAERSAAARPEGAVLRDQA